MPEEPKKYHIFLSAAEHSADAHCANLIKALKKTGLEIDFVGVGGEKMASQGCRLLETTAGKAAMLHNALGHVWRFYKLIKRIDAFFAAGKVDLVIVCDSPAFNFHIAKAARKYNAKIIFYVAPQLWAWGAWRLEKLRKSCDKLCCILPFEQHWFGQRGLDAVFVGSPLLDDCAADLTPYIKQFTSFEPRRSRILLLPGSRDAEIQSLWRPMQQIAVRLKQRYPQASFTTVAVDEKTKERLRASHILNFRCDYAVGNVSQTARQCDFAIAASGSVTLEVAAAGCPMAVMYQSSRLLWHLIGRWLIKTSHFSLVNILAETRLVPEFMPYFTSTEPIVLEISRLLDDPARLAQISSHLITLTQPLAGNASQKVADIAASMLT